NPAPFPCPGPWGAAAGNRPRRCHAPGRSVRPKWARRNPACPKRPSEAPLSRRQFLGFGQLLEQHGALEAGEMIDEQNPFQMVHLMLQAGGEHAVGFDLYPLAVEVEIFAPD